MSTVPFTQYLRPDGEKRAMEIEVPDDIAAKAKLIIEAGFRFEIEELMNGKISMTVSDDDADYTHEICANGHAVPDHVHKLITEFDIEAGLAERAAVLSGEGD